MLTAGTFGWLCPLTFSAAVASGLNAARQRHGS